MRRIQRGVLSGVKINFSRRSTEGRRQNQQIQFRIQHIYKSTGASIVVKTQKHLTLESLKGVRPFVSCYFETSPRKSKLCETCPFKAIVYTPESGNSTQTLRVLDANAKKGCYHAWNLALQPTGQLQVSNLKSGSRIGFVMGLCFFLIYNLWAQLEHWNTYLVACICEYGSDKSLFTLVLEEGGYQYTVALKADK